MCCKCIWLLIDDILYKCKWEKGKLLIVIVIVNVIYFLKKKLIMLCFVINCGIECLMIFSVNV